jgi:transposase
MGRRHELTEAERARLAPLLPRRRASKPRKDDRLVINGILWKLATGAPGGVLPERSGPWQSVDTRYRRWRRAGIWDGMLAAVQPQADAACALDWAVHFVDGTVIRAHQHAAGAKGGTRRRKRSAVARAGSASSSARRAAASR